MSSHTHTDVIPRPQEITTEQETVGLPDPVVVAPDGSEGARAEAGMAADLIAREAGVAAEAGGADADGATLALSVVDAVDGVESDPAAYSLSVADDGVTVEATARAGLQYGVQTLCTLIEYEDGAPVVPLCTVRDWPENGWRGVLVDPARHFIPVERLREIIDQMARAKLNLLHLHLLDSQSYALASEAHPELGVDPETGEQRPVYSHEEMRDLVEYAAERNVDLLPELDLPGHATQFIETFPEVQCAVPDGEASDWTVCAGTEATYDLLADLVAEVADIFPYPVVHIGGDEYAHQGVSWADCEVCGERMAAEGFDRPRELFYYFLRRVDGILDDHDRRMMLWNDQIDIADPPPIPEDVLVHFWTVMRPELGPAEGCSMDRFMDEGFEVVNSHSPATYVSHWADHELFKAWEPTQLPTVSEENVPLLRGGELAMWNGPRWDEQLCHAYHRRQMPATLPIFGDRVWHGGDPLDDDALADAVARHTLGPAFEPRGDLYEQLGGVLLPSDLEEKAHVYRSLAGRTVAEAIPEYRELIDALTDLREAGEAVYPNTADAYVECLEWLVEVAEREGRGYRERP